MDPGPDMRGVVLQTERLMLRRWKPSDLEPYAGMCRDPEVMRYIAGCDTRTRDQCARGIEAMERHSDGKGFGLFALELRESVQFIGYTGLSEPDFLPEIMPAVEIGWRLSRDRWGQGYATEAARAVMQFGFVTLGLPSIVSIFQIGNEASRRLVRKLGMQLDRRTQDPSSNRPVEVWRISARNAGV